MDYEETMVDEEFDDTEVDDTLPEGIIEEDESEEEFPDEEELDIDDLDDDSESYEEPEEEAPADDEPPPTEPGWMKKRIGKAVEKAVRETEARMQAMFEQQMKPIREKMIEDEAQELVRSRKVADIETARELVRYRQGQPTSANTHGEAQVRGEQPRNDRGQFTSQEQIANDARTRTQIDMLARQADKIKANGGPDVIKEFTENKDLQRRVVNGELDMYDIADMMQSRKTKRPPTPARSPNGAANSAPNAFSNMSSKQFKKFEDRLEEGGSYTFRH